MLLAIPTRGPIRIDARGETPDEILLQLHQVVPRVWRARLLTVEADPRRDVLHAVSTWCRQQQLHAMARREGERLILELYLLPRDFGETCQLRTMYEAA